ncbi:MAG TPA: mechanosensitive ion channel domain-containing protein [Steroidobacteraceae bacterium]|nr:mechanosensitive ion channel domain-containing protein [Steroidobacteraceae bacterium]
MNETWQMQLEALGRTYAQFQDPTQWWQIGVIAFSVALAWLSTRGLAKHFAGIDRAGPASAYQRLMTLGSRIAFPLLLGLVTLIAAAIMRRYAIPQAVLSLVATLALAFALIHLVVDLLKRVLRPGPLLIAAERLITWVIWAVVAMYLFGWLEHAAAALDSIAIPMGDKRYSLLDALSAIVTLLVFLVIGGYLGTLATRGIMRAQQVTIGLRVGIAKFLRFFLVLLAGLLGLNAIGIDLAALTVFGGALGIGLGFGLQRIAANFVSGFILIADRSIRQGDVITIGDRFGVVKELRARYIVVRDRDGVDTLIPNENVISTDVVNWSYGDRAIRLKLSVQISYKDKPRQALELLLEAAARHPRVLKNPAPASRVMSFADSGIALELRFWILDPEDGVNNVRSDLHLEIWDLFEREGITIPYPQRDLHLPDGWPPRLEKESPAEK